MSGRKYSQVELANNVREAIRCRLVAEEAVARAEGLASALREAAVSTPALQCAVSTATEALGRIHHQLDTMRDEFVESRMLRLDLDQVRVHRRAVDELKAEILELERQCRAGRDSAAIRVELASVLDHLVREQSQLETWLSDEYAAYLGQTRRLLNQVDEDIHRKGVIEGSADVFAGHSARFEALLARAHEHRALDAERQYVARALAEICTRDMGFSVKVLPQKSSLDDLVVEVDTFAFGLIHFRLQLDGTIRSQSELVETSCCANFALLEDRLKSLGVISSFRYEGDQRPVRLQKGEKALPDAGRGASAKRSAS